MCVIIVLVLVCFGVKCFRWIVVLRLRCFVLSIGLFMFGLVMSICVFGRGVWCFNVICILVSVCGLIMVCFFMLLVLSWVCVMCCCVVLLRKICCIRFIMVMVV